MPPNDIGSGCQMLIPPPTASVKNLPILSNCSPVATGMGLWSATSLERDSRSAVVGSSHQNKSKSRSEEHTSELQSLTNLVCRLLLEKKKKNTTDSVCTYTHY